MLLECAGLSFTILDGRALFDTSIRILHTPRAIHPLNRASEPLEEETFSSTCAIYRTKEQLIDHVSVLTDEYHSSNLQLAPTTVQRISYPTTIRVAPSSAAANSTASHFGTPPPATSTVLPRRTRSCRRPQRGRTTNAVSVSVRCDVAACSRSSTVAADGGQS